MRGETCGTASAEDDVGEETQTERQEMNKKMKEKRISAAIRRFGKAYCRRVKKDCFGGDNKRFRAHVAEVIGVKL